MNNVVTPAAYRTHIRKNRMKRFSGLKENKIDDLFDQCVSYCEKQDKQPVLTGKHSINIIEYSEKLNSFILGLLQITFMYWILS